MTFENITENRVLNAAGRLVDPGVKISMPVSYYAEQKPFVDAYVEDKTAKITGMEEYTAFLGRAPEKEEPVENVDLMDEVIEEEKAKEEQKEIKEPEEAKEAPVVKEEPKEVPEAKETPKPKTRRRRQPVKATETEK